MLKWIVLTIQVQAQNNKLISLADLLKYPTTRGEKIKMVNLFSAVIIDGVLTIEKG